MRAMISPHTATELKAPHDSPTLVLEGLVCSSNGPRLDLVLRAGECVALLDLDDGPQGLAPLAETLAGHTSPAAGRIVVNSVDVTVGEIGRRGLATVGRRDPLFPPLTVRENVAFPARARGASATEASRSASEWLALLGLESIADRRPEALGSGERIRTAIARALASNPSALVLDDIFVGLDGETRRDLHHRLARLRLARGLTLLLITRDRADALTGANRIGVVAEGSLLQLADAGTLIERPHCARVATAMGDANVLIGLILSLDDDIAQVRLAAGGVAEAMADPDLREGDLVELCVRPAQIAPMFPRGATRDDDDGLPATLQDIAHLGDVLRLRFRLEDGSDLIVHRPPGSLPPGVVAGRPARLAWRPGGALAFPSTTKQR